MTIDLNADVGEASTEAARAAELEVLDAVTSANIACGAHAGTDETMRATVRAASARGLAIGAHPGYPDRDGQGRRSMPLDAGAITATVVAQIRHLATLAGETSATLTYVKAHGALYNDAARDPDIASAIANAVRLVDRKLRLVGLSGSALIAAGRAAGLSTVDEAFVDRAYRFDGTLVPRTQAGAVLTDPATVVRRACDLALRRPIATADGSSLLVHADTLCLHADTPGAAMLGHEIRRALTNLGIVVSATGAS